MALSPDAKLAAVLGNAACLYCAAWDHSVHKFAGGKASKEPKCTVSVNGTACGSQHGRWYHDSVKTGNTNSVIVSAAPLGPGLY